ncbi:MAG: hypothetical protein ACYTBJ_02730 [Planctomycetota bacterium]
MYITPYFVALPAHLYQLVVLQNPDALLATALHVFGPSHGRRLSHTPCYLNPD